MLLAYKPVKIYINNLINKKMKRFRLPVIIVIAMTFGFIQQSNAQKQSNGLYLTYNDYLNHKLSYVSSKIYTHEFLEGKTVAVISNGQKQVFEKSNVFGYRDDAGNDYRFYSNKAYQIVDTAEFCIYKSDRLVQQGKGPKPVTGYYFSKKTGDEILALTPENIDRAFADNAKFRFMVEAAYHNDVKLDTYDSLLHEYKIKELYTASLK